MKRFVFSVVLLVSAFACSGSPEVDATIAASDRGVSTIELPPSDVIELTEDQSDAADDLAHTVPTGTFESPSAFCAAQMKLVASKIEEVKTIYEAEGREVSLGPACDETPKVLEGANVALVAPYTDVTAVTFETGYSLESYLLVKSGHGWVAVRAAMLYVNHDDPGCGSIERPGEILDVQVDKGAIVVKTTAGRTWWSAKDESGELTMTYARACRGTAAGIACGTPEVIDAKVVLQPDELQDPEAPVVTRFFSTTYAVGNGVSIETATRFDESAL